MFVSPSNGKDYSLNNSINKKREVENNLMILNYNKYNDKNNYSIYERMKFYNVPAVSIAVIDSGEISWTEAYGFVDGEERIKAEDTTLFQAASISKSVNALSIVKLCESNKLSLYSDISSYLKTWNIPFVDTLSDEKITLKSLLSHSAGINVQGFDGYSLGSKIPNLNQMLNGSYPANNVPITLIQKPNTNFLYSGGGILITRKIIEDMLYDHYYSIIEDIVLKPLQMHNSSFNYSLSINAKRFATGHYSDGTPLFEQHFIYPELSPDGLWTTPKDIALFILAIQKSLNKDRRSFLSHSFATEILTPVLENSNAGLGVFISGEMDNYFFGHSGGNKGFSSEYIAGFHSGQAAVVMVNSDNHLIISEILNAISRVYDWKGWTELED